MLRNFQQWKIFQTRAISKHFNLFLVPSLSGSFPDLHLATLSPGCLLPCHISLMLCSARLQPLPHSPRKLIGFIFHLMGMSAREGSCSSFWTTLIREHKERSEELDLPYHQNRPLSRGCLEWGTFRTLLIPPCLWIPVSGTTGPLRSGVSKDHFKKPWLGPEAEADILIFSHWIEDSHIPGQCCYLCGSCWVVHREEAWQGDVGKGGRDRQDMLSPFCKPVSLHSLVSNGDGG